MAKKLYGTDPDQVPTNADLGTIAYQDKGYLNVGEVHSDNQTIVSTDGANAFSVTTNASSNVALSIGGGNTINGVASSPQSFYILNVARDSGSGKSTYFNGNVGFPNGYGIDFSASEGSGATSSVLDDYEEGTFTPVVRGRNVVGTGTYTRQSGFYTKVGRTVTIHIDIGWSAHTGSGGMEISLPFATGSGYQAGGFMSYNSGMTYGAAAGDIVSLWMDSSSTNLRFYYYNRTGGNAQINVPSTIGEAHFQIIYNT